MLKFLNSHPPDLAAVRERVVAHTLHEESPIFHPWHLLVGQRKISVRNPGKLAAVHWWYWSRWPNGLMRQLQYAQSLPSSLCRKCLIFHIYILPFCQRAHDVHVVFLSSQQPCKVKGHLVSFMEEWSWAFNKGILRNQWEYWHPVRCVVKQHLIATGKMGSGLLVPNLFLRGLRPDYQGQLEARGDDKNTEKVWA